MIKIILKGGLGNQMFQYATAKSLALDLNTDVQLDLTYLNCRPPIPDFTVRSYELDLFNLNEKKSALLDFPIIKKYAYPLQKIINTKINRNYACEGDKQMYDYSPRLFTKSTTQTVEGYFNNYKYFISHDQEIKDIFDTEKLYDPQYTSFEKRIMETNSVSINIRRGDYTNNKHKNIFTYLDIDYYQGAIEKMRRIVKKPLFFVFSYDDPEWLSKNLDLNRDELIIVDKNYIGERFKTYLRLISLCKHNIISNSTFAFWGAYLNKNNEKVIVGPKSWAYGTKFDYPSKWFSI